MRIDVAQVFFVNEVLKEILLWIEYESGLDLIITKFNGTVKFKGVELAMRHQSVAEMIVELVNSKWVYDYNRRALKCADVQGIGCALRVHIQVHNNTRMIQA